MSGGHGSGGRSPDGRGPEDRSSGAGSSGGRDSAGGRSPMPRRTGPAGGQGGQGGQGGAPRVAALLLAAGESRRLGGIDKRLLRLDGVPLLRRWFQVFGQAGIRDVVIVLGQEPQRVEPLLAGADAIRVHNPDPGRGQQSSVLAGLAALPAGVDAVMVVLVDLLLVDAADLRALIDAFAARPAGTTAVVPFHDGRRGNPVIVTAAVAAEVTVAADEAAGLRGHLQAHPEEVFRWQAGSDHFVVDLDTPQDLEVLQQRLGDRLSLPD